MNVGQCDKWCDISEEVIGGRKYLDKGNISNEIKGMSQGCFRWIQGGKKRKLITKIRNVKLKSFMHGFQTHFSDGYLFSKENN